MLDNVASSRKKRSRTLTKNGKLPPRRSYASLKSASARGSQRTRAVQELVRSEEVISDYPVTVGRGNGRRVEAVMGLGRDREEKVEVSF